VGQFPRPGGPLTRPPDRSGGTPGHRTSLRAKLLVLLLAFGLVPTVLAIVVGYAVSRVTILEQAHEALQSIADAQAVHFSTELSREQLLLRTIVGQLPDPATLRRMSTGALADLLSRSLPEDGVFDGLRLTTGAGGTLAGVALRQTAPHWPPDTPAADWSSTPVFVHRDQDRVLAYVVAAPVARGPDVWLEGHVRAADFRRIFSVPEHLLPGMEAGVFQRDRRQIFGAHEHTAVELAPLVEALYLDSARSRRGLEISGILISVAPVPGFGWSFVAALPIDYALAPLSRLRTAALLGTLVLILLLTVTALGASRSVADPLRRLAEAAGVLGREERAQPLPVRSRDEVGALVEAFNTMAENLDQSRREVERLHAQDLERAQQLATVGELASGVAHEVRNPLTGVRGALEMALRRIPETDPSRPLLAEADQQLARIDGTITQLLQYARPPVLKELTVDAGLLVERASHIVAPQAAAAGVTARVQRAEVPVPVTVDPELIVQVLVNLMLNGIEAMSKGGTLTTWVARHAPSVLIGVRDTGPGVAADQLNHIFRPFYTTKHKGTGLGLPISRNIIVRHGGSLRLEDPAGPGAAFVISLPLTQGGPR
jgi:signal transduction histidine kinase